MSSGSKSGLMGSHEWGIYNILISGFRVGPGGRSGMQCDLPEFGRERP